MVETQLGRRAVIVVEQDLRHVVTGALSQLRLTGVFAKDTLDAITWLDHNAAPDLLVLQRSLTGDILLEQLRSRTRLAGLPAIVIAGEPPEAQLINTRFVTTGARLAHGIVAAARELLDEVEPTLRVTPARGAQSVHFWCRPSA